MDALINIMGIIVPSAITLIGCMINNNLQRAKEQHAIEMKIAEINANYDKSTALIKKEIQDLSERVNKHNNLIERMYKCEVVDSQLNVINDYVEFLDKRTTPQPEPTE